MELRIKGDSLRLRLTQVEVQQFGATGTVEERVRFGGECALIYRLHRDAAAVRLAASFADGAIEVRVPAPAARQWCSTDEVTLADRQASGLRIVVEKDFACLKPRADEDESDNFPHPQAMSVRYSR